MFFGMDNSSIFNFSYMILFPSFFQEQSPFLKTTCMTKKKKNQPSKYVFNLFISPYLLSLEYLSSPN